MLVQPLVAPAPAEDPAVLHDASGAAEPRPEQPAHRRALARRVGDALDACESEEERARFVRRLYALRRMVRRRRYLSGRSLSWQMSRVRHVDSLKHDCPAPRGV